MTEPKLGGPIRGQVLSRTLDSELQAYVSEAAREAGAAIALVSVLLEGSQFFRAHHGLPRELEVARATSRSSSFCQFVVRDGEAFEVEDALNDSRLPQDLVRNYGIRSYFGVPVETDGQVVGALCVIDKVPRKFEPSLKARLEEIGRRASARLQALAGESEHPHQRLVQLGSAPAFAEVRNMMTPVALAPTQLRLLVADLAPFAEIASANLTDTELRRVLEAQSPSVALDALLGLASDLETVSSRLIPSLRALEQASSESPPAAPISQIVSTGLELAHHRTKLVGGVTLANLHIGEVVASTLSLGASLVSVVACLMADLAQTEVGCRIESRGSKACAVIFEAPRELSCESRSSLKVEASSLAESVANVGVEPTLNGLCLLFSKPFPKT